MRKTWLVMLAQLLVMLAWFFLRPALLPEGPSGAAGQYWLQIAQEALMFGIPALVLRPWKSEGVHRSRYWRRGCWQGLAAGVALAVAAQPVSAWWSSLLLVAPQETPLPAGGPQWALMALAMIGVPALAEEAFFRGGMLCGLAKGVGGKAAFALTVAAFTMMHGRIGALPAHAACGALFTLMMLRYGSLWPSVAAHLAYNTVTLLLALTGAGVAWAVAAAAAAALGTIVAMVLRDTEWRERDKLKKTDVALGGAAVAVLVLYFMVQLR